MHRVSSSGLLVIGSYIRRMHMCAARAGVVIKCIHRPDICLHVPALTAGTLDLAGSCPTANQVREVRERGEQPPRNPHLTRL